MEHRRALYVLSARRFPRTCYYNAYQNFHWHLPENLFYVDFVTYLKKVNAQTYKKFNKAFKDLDTLENEPMLDSEPGYESQPSQ